MMKMKKLLAVLLAVTALTLCLCLAGCGEQEQQGTTAPAGEAGTYTVSVKTAGGMAMEGVSVYVYADEKLEDMLGYGTTDAEGKASISLEAGSHYITLSTVPKGYAVETFYRFEGTAADIVLTSSLITEEDISTATLGVGDIMYDFTVTKPDGEAVTLSEVLKQKKVAILNFWYTTCTYCVQEFPLMQSAYEQSKDAVGIIALDPMDSSEAVKSFQQNYSLTFDMASCPTSWSQVFGIQGYPTTVVVDRYGMICLVESGALLAERYWTTLFNHFTADVYEQRLLTAAGELLTQVEPDVEMPSQEELTQALGTGDMTVTYRADEDTYAWPFVITERGGMQCIQSPNKELDGSYAIIYADVTLEEGQALGFDYLKSTEAGADVLHVIVNDEAIYSISGVNSEEKWETCYPIVADHDGVYELALCYIKDEGDQAGEDTVYISNMRLVDVNEIDVPTYLPRKVAESEDGFTYTYKDIVLNSTDGYYHVGTADGPLLLVDLMDYTDFNEEETIWEMTYNGEIKLDDVDYTEILTQYANYASNANLNGICTVNEELFAALLAVDQICGFDETDDKEWLKACKYFEAYGTGGVQLEDPIKGLATFSAYTASLGKNIETNRFDYNRIIIPRGMFAEFIPERAGVYRITSRTESTNGVEGWIFNENREELLVYERDERMFTDGDEISMVFYMEAGKPYYIDIAFWDPYEEGTIYYDIEYVAATFDLFRLCSQGYFTYDTDATGTAMYDVIAGGIDVVLGEDGYYYHDLGEGQQGSRIYADFTGVTGVFSEPIATVGGIKGLIDKGAFDFSKTENDQYVLTALEINGGDKEKTLQYLKEQWATEYEAYYEEYQVDDVFAGVYHGEGEDYTDDIKTYLDKIIRDGHEEREGCVEVDAKLAQILQKLMDKFTFEDVDNAWIKLCYYYDHLGPQS